MSAAEIDALAHRLRPHYGRFLARRDGEVLLTAHSHQAWPDVAREAHLEAWDDAARYVDGKWRAIFDEVLPAFRRRVVQRLGSDRADHLAVAPNTHELGERLLSCLSPAARIVTTDGEFHSLRRQLSRSAEDGLRVEWVPVEDSTPAESAPERDAEARDRRLADRIVAAVDRSPTDLVALSHVFFGTGRVFRGLQGLLDRLAQRSVPVLVDLYHSFNVLQLSLDRWPGQVFAVGGGYKYAQSGEGNCWMLLPRNLQSYRPRYTGWFSDFAHLSETPTEVGYGPGFFRFMGSTFDPTPFYRGRRVLAWMDAEGLTPAVLEAAIRRSTGFLIARYDALRLADRGLALRSPRSPRHRGGFVAFGRADAAALSDGLRARGIHTDVRGDVIRLGPAPYTDSRGLDRAMHALAEML